MARMVRAGEDPDYIFRRMLVSASEDIGLADPQALGQVVSAAEAFRRVGLPEGQYFLAQAALYLAAAPKSNSTLGYFEALKSLETEEAKAVPNHLKDANRDSQAFGHGRGYQYPHAFKDHWVSQQYLPGGMASQVFYQPSDQGWEGTIRARILERRELVLGHPAAEDDPETLTWTDGRNTPWVRRLDLGDAGPLAGLRQEVFAAASIQRHDRVWVASDTNGLLLLEALRRTPEGRVWASLPDGKRLRSIEEYLAFVPEFHRPVLGSGGWGVFPDGGEGSPDLVLAWGPALPPGWVPPEGPARVVVVDPEPGAGTRLSSLVSPEVLAPGRWAALAEAEEDFHSERSPSAVREGWGLAGRLWTVTAPRHLSKDDWDSWWTPGSGRPWTEYLVARDPGWAEDLARIRPAFPGGSVPWVRAWTLWTPSEARG
jgi:putative ATPase